MINFDYVRSLCLIVVLFVCLQNAALAEYDNNVINPDVVDYQVTATKLDKARNNLSTETGSSTYTFNQQNIDNLPRGDNTSLNQVLLRAPGVVQDSYGQLHIREDHDNLQYRINGILIPEGISGFGQTLDTHFANQINLLTGALPAQYGYHTAGVVDIQTKSGAFVNGGVSQVTLGSHGEIGGNQQFSGSKEKWNYYLNASYLQNNLGIESPTASANPIHDSTKQNKQFGYLSYLLDSDTRLSFIFSNANSHFQIPNVPGASSNFTLNGFDKFDSSNINENQSEVNRYAILALQGTTSLNVDYQLALFSRYSAVKFEPDSTLDLIANGVASDIRRANLVSGVQGDFSYKLNDNNTIRSGLMVSRERAISDADNAVFMADDYGNQLGGTPVNISNDSKSYSDTYSVYLQDEWKIIDRLTINYGARYDNLQGYIASSQLSPRLGAIYELTPSTKIHAGYAKYFTPPPLEPVTPQIISAFANTTNAAENNIQDVAKPERTDYYDIGITHKLTSEINLGLDAYYKDIKNLLDDGQFGNALIFTPFNYQYGKAYGIEFTSDYHKNNLTAYFNLGLQTAMGKNVVSNQYLFSEEDLGYLSNHYVHLDHDQNLTGSLGATYKFKDMRYTVDAIYGSGLRNGPNNTQHLPGYTQVNLGVDRMFNFSATGKFNGRLSVINVFDKIYQMRDGTGIGVFAPQYGARRAYYVTISKSY